MPSPLAFSLFSPVNLSPAVLFGKLQISPQKNLLHRRAPCRNFSYEITSPVTVTAVDPDDSSNITRTFRDCRTYEQIMEKTGRAMGGRGVQRRIISFSPEESESEYATLPIFPLSSVLFPTGTTPLHIFEPRYLKMFDRILSTDGRFGIVMSNQSPLPMASVGCCAEIVQHETLRNGRMLIVCYGRRRFKILEITQTQPHIEARVQWFRDAIDLEAVIKLHVDDDEAFNLAQLESKVFSTLRDVLMLENDVHRQNYEFTNPVWALAPSDAQPLPNQPPLIVDGTMFQNQLVATGDHLFSFSVASVLDMDLRDQQRFLQTTDPLVRLKQEALALDTSRRFLIAKKTLRGAFETESANENENVEEGHAEGGSAPKSNDS